MRAIPVHLLRHTISVAALNSNILGPTYTLMVETHTKPVVFFDCVLFGTPVAELLIVNALEKLLDIILVAAHREIRVWSKYGRLLLST